VWIVDELLNKEKPTTHIAGVDFADIDPFSALGKSPKKHPMVSFCKNTSVDKLPFDDHSIDMAISQYGLEYSNLEKTIPELARVLKPRAKMSFILHDKASDIVKENLPQVEIMKYVLDELKLHEYYIRQDELNNSAKNIHEFKSNLDIVACRAKTNLALSELSEKVHKICALEPKHITTYVCNLNAEFNENLPFRNLKRKNAIVGHMKTLQVILERIEDLSTAALDEEELIRLVGYIEKEGFSIVEQKKLQYRDSANWGSILVAERNGD
jgi:ubiquinone/menaquinone biosynthesis C-methylase UbiE